MKSSQFHEYIVGLCVDGNGFGTRLPDDCHRVTGLVYMSSDINGLTVRRRRRLAWFGWSDAPPPHLAVRAYVLTKCFKFRSNFCACREQNPQTLSWIAIQSSQDTYTATEKIQREVRAYIILPQWCFGKNDDRHSDQPKAKRYLFTR